MHRAGGGARERPAAASAPSRVSRPSFAHITFCPVAVVATKQDMEQLFSDLCPMSDLVSPVRSETHYQLLNLGGMTASERIALATNWEVVVQRVRSAEPVRLYMICLPRSPCATSTNVTSAARLRENDGSLTRSQGRPRSLCTGSLEFAKSSDVMMFHRLHSIRPAKSASRPANDRRSAASRVRSFSRSGLAPRAARRLQRLVRQPASTTHSSCCV